MALLALGGCIRADQGQAFKAHGAQPVLFMGYDYAGTTAQVAQGAADIDVDAARDTGTAVFTFGAGNQTFEVRFAQFHEAQPFQQGGVRNDFPEHGDTGNGDAQLPTIHALSAGWGSGTVTLGGQALRDPVSRDTTFTLHYMVTDTGPRDPASRKVTKADGSTPYDPAAPADAKTFPVREVLLNVQGATGPAAPVNESFSVTSSLGPMTDETKDAFAINGTSAAVNISYALQGPAAGAPALGQATFVLLADGTEVDRCEVSLPPADPTAGTTGCTHEVPSAAPGIYTVHVTGTGVGNPYAVTGSVAREVKPLFLHVVYTDVTVG
jgi:hypothetical protein